MGRPLDEETVIKIVEYECGEWMGLAKEIVKQIKALPSAEPQWIPCDERMPEEKDAGFLKKLGINERSDTVLVTVRVKEDCITDDACTKDGVWDWDLKYAFPDHEVVAWMPWPKPYKGGKRNENRTDKT